MKTNILTIFKCKNECQKQLVRKNIQDEPAKLCNGNDYDKSVTLVVDMVEADFKLRDLKVQLGQFFKTADSKTKIFTKHLFQKLLVKFTKRLEWCKMDL